jgi:hypothetical protein
MCFYRLYEVSVKNKTDWHNYFIPIYADLSGVVARPENIFLKLDLDNASERTEISQSPCLNRLGLCI